MTNEKEEQFSQLQKKSSDKVISHVQFEWAGLTVVMYLPFLLLVKCSRHKITISETTRSEKTTTSN